MCAYVPKDTQENIVKQVTFKLWNGQRYRYDWVKSSSSSVDKSDPHSAVRENEKKQTNKQTKAQKETKLSLFTIYTINNSQL